MDKKDLKSLIISVIIVSVVSIFCVVFWKLTSNQTEYDHLKNYKVNEYIPTHVSTEDLLKIYLNDYLYNMRYNEEIAYKSLDKKYRDKKFGSLENYHNYVIQFLTKEISAKKYMREYKDGRTIYKVYDQDDNVYIFKTSGIMQYSLFLDEDTVEIR